MYYGQNVPNVDTASTFNLGINEEISTCEMASRSMKNYCLIALSCNKHISEIGALK